MKRLLPIAVALPVLLPVAVLVVLAGCSSAPDDAVVFPSDRVELVASYQVRGGMMPAALSAIEPPVLMVYSDGTVVSRALRTLTLSTRDLTGLVRDLRHDLGGLTGSVTSGSSNQVSDAPSTYLAVRRADGTLQSVGAYALGISKDYPRGLLRAADRLSKLAGRTDKTGTAYESDRVRLVLEPRQQATDTVRTWPAGVAEPPIGTGSVRTTDLDGQAARDVAAAFPPVLASLGGSWPTYRLPDGSMYAVAWRYLTPEEPPN